MRHKNTFFMAGGDKNELDIKNLLDISPTFHNLNTKHTHGNKNIDVIVTDRTHLFEESVIMPNIPTDIPDGQPGGKKTSDQPIVFSRPRTNMIKPPKKEVIVKKLRRIDDETLRKIGQRIQRETWEEVFDANSASIIAVKLPEVIMKQLELICPIEEIKISKYEGKITSKALQNMARLN